MDSGKAARKVLVVDDDPHLLNLLEIRLAGEGFDVEVASAAAQALEKAAARPPEIVIADIMMPGMDGYALCERIRSSEELKNIPFIFLSALADTQDKVRGLRLGADDYLTKPFEFHELLARIEILLDRYSRYQETFEREAEGGGEIATAGNIEDLGVIDLLQMLSFGQKTGEVDLESGEEKGVLYLAGGKLIAADYRAKRGQAALPNLLAWSEGRFRIKLSDSLSVIPTIEHQTDEAIFEALRVLDEAERIKQELDAKSVPVLKNADQAEGDVEQAALDLCDGERTVDEILKQSPRSDFETLKAMRSLAERGAIELMRPSQAREVKEREFNLMVIGTERETRNAFIHAVSGEESKEEEGKVLNFGKVQQGPVLLNLYGLPGAKRFAPLWQTFVSKVQGMILLADPGSEDDLANVRFAVSLLSERIQGPTILINTDPTKPEINLGEETKVAKTLTCLPSDRVKASGILKDLVAELIR